MTDQKASNLIEALKVKIAEANDEARQLTIARGFKLRAQQLGRAEGLREALMLVEKHLEK